MSAISSAAAAPARPSTFGGLLRLLRVWGDALATYWVRREAIKTLRQLDDRALRDIGLSRCQIETAVTGDFDLELVRIR
ncbi:DUF1127 domain-containing protein [Bradyrhizobium brasilense]|uniref:DUF1127 domain-containing protein n=1 Tax=Bradyrhizobium brasilense TaxID=1419277 RepID=UPI001E4D2972|nr:DUF1127 domain-containing protein [Bradyrhizobium brasilense]MCP1914655.1 uncharacterized protein YjiS (DUF1127 family) [Bradyrhizobium elkanii]